ncbi:hypothetical protein F2Q70_00008009 [Brassica cretica]|uniref:Uncharacterized protein n=1 Tax=Brassica cretica TaxID=69181 RepID=A0A8S9M086_BRACR|nr:hypothetical protein F2Q68_00001038 [Brassica cretica]KAF2611717.1 hypothetical protein F2Q70_00008009 [Brassica cretica]
MNIEARTEALSSGAGKGVSRRRLDSMIDLSLLLTVMFWFSRHQLCFVIFFLMFTSSSPFADYESNRGHRCTSPPMALISFCYVCLAAVPLLHLDTTLRFLSSPLPLSPVCVHRIYLAFLRRYPFAPSAVPLSSSGSSHSRKRRRTSTVLLRDYNKLESKSEHSPLRRRLSVTFSHYHRASTEPSLMSNRSLHLFQRWCFLPPPRRLHPPPHHCI